MQKKALLVVLVLSIPFLILADEQEKPCMMKAEHRQFDFWIGEWDIFFRDQRIASSSIQQIVEGCMILENYSQDDGYTGKSVNFYDIHLRAWRQTWVDAGGMVSEFHGEVREDGMHFEGESHYPDGGKKFRRMKVLSLDADRLRQVSEISNDGKTWKPHYDLLYVRKKH